MNETTTRFLKQFRHWGLHCAICAAPSFAIAGLFLNFFDSAANTAAMLAGITLFILGYSLLSTFWKPLHDPEHPLSKSLRLALKIRLFISAASLFFLILAASGGGDSAFGALLFLPDYWAGMLAFTILNHSMGFFGVIEMLPESENFITTLIWTLLEGGILSFALFMLTFFCLMIVSARQKKAWQNETLAGAKPTSS